MVYDRSVGLCSCFCGGEVEAVHQFVIQTDHRNFFVIMISLSGRVGRWRLELQEYDFLIQHLPGRDNVVADALSRCLVALDDEKVGWMKSSHNDVVGHLG
jgi:hypothetical protein